MGTNPIVLPCALMLLDHLLIWSLSVIISAALVAIAELGRKIGRVCVLLSSDYLDFLSFDLGILGLGSVNRRASSLINV